MSALTARLADLLDSTLTGVQDKLVMREDCQECKASGGGWCPPCLELETQSEALGLAVAQVKRAVSDTEAAAAFNAVISLVTGLPEMAAVLVLPGVAR